MTTKVRYNAWIDLSKVARETDLLVGMDLRGIDFDMANMRWGNLSDADMRGTSLRGTNLQDADMRWTDMRGVDTRRADMRRADMREADLREIAPGGDGVNRLKHSAIGFVNQVTPDAIYTICCEPCFKVIRARTPKKVIKKAVARGWTWRKESAVSVEGKYTVVRCPDCSALERGKEATV